MGLAAIFAQGRHDEEKKRKMRIGRPVGASGELIRSFSCNSKWEFGVRGATCGFNTKHQSTKGQSALRSNSNRNRIKLSFGVVAGC
jgi:hypothetical protein